MALNRAVKNKNHKQMASALHQLWQLVKESQSLGIHQRGYMAVDDALITVLGKRDFRTSNILSSLVDWHNQVKDANWIWEHESDSWSDIEEQARWMSKNALSIAKIGGAVNKVLRQR
jgi:hypothetical protein